MLHCLNSNFYISCSLVNGGFLNISTHLSIKIILVDCNLVHAFFAHNFFDPSYCAHP